MKSATPTFVRRRNPRRLVLQSLTVHTTLVVVWRWRWRVASVVESRLCLWWAHHQSVTCLRLLKRFIGFPLIFVAPLTGADGIRVRKGGFPSAVKSCGKRMMDRVQYRAEVRVHSVAHYFTSWAISHGRDTRWDLPVHCRK
jgi:hypothetical protein